MSREPLHWAHECHGCHQMLFTACIVQRSETGVTESMSVSGGPGGGRALCGDI